MARIHLAVHQLDTRQMVAVIGVLPVDHHSVNRFIALLTRSGCTTTATRNIGPQRLVYDRLPIRVLKLDVLGVLLHFDLAAPLV